jgi:hypothetical protein
MPTRIAVPEIAVDELVRVVDRDSPPRVAISKMRAILALRHSGSPHKRQVFAAVLADPRELPRFKHMAVAGLLELGGERAEEALIENLQYADEYTADAFALALGRVGSPRSAEVVRTLRSVARPAFGDQVDFAVSLLAYRHNLPGDEVDVPSGDELLSVQAETGLIPIEVTPADDAAVASAMRALEREPLGIEITGAGASSIVCGPNRFLLIWNREFEGARFAKLRKRKGVAGVQFLKSRFNDEYSVASLVLVTPRGEHIAISVHTPRGEAVMAGSTRFEGGSFSGLTLQSVQRPGAAVLEFKGAVSDGRLQVDEARSSAVVVERKLPRSVTHPAQ